jgi:uncharacterized protein (DUF433 family)
VRRKWLLVVAAFAVVEAATTPEKTGKAMTFTITAEPVPLEKNPDGVIHIGGTRVTLDTIVAVFESGATPEEIVQRYSSLDIADVYVALGYYLRHRAEVEEYLRERQEQADEVRRLNQARFNQQGVRERLLARTAQQKADSDASPGR